MEPNKEELDQLAWDNYWKKNPGKALAENSRPDMVIGYVDGWNANPAQYTEEDIKACWNAAAAFYKSNSGIDYRTWLENYKNTTT